MQRRVGLSRLEAVVLLLVLLCLAALGLSFVSKVREAAARMTCQNNLKQLTLGVGNYYDVNRSLPPLTDQGEGAPTGAGLPSVFATLGPFLEASYRMYRPGQTPAANYNAASSVSFTVPYKGGGEGKQHGGDANQIWKTFLDPADTSALGLRDVPVTLPDGTTGYYATGSYAANGLLSWGKKAAPKSLADWSGSCVLFGERPQVCTTASGETVHNLWGMGFYSPQMPAFGTLTPTEPPGLWSTGQVAPVLPLRNEAGADLRVRTGRGDSLPQAPDFPTPLQRIAHGGPCDPRLPGTPHRVGMQAAMIDGSVRIFASDTEPWVFWAACAPPRLEATP